MNELPRTGGIDDTLAFKREPYDYISRHCRRLNTDVFETRLLGRKTLCMRGREAAELFYDPRYFMRHGAAPEPLQKTLLGTTGVQTLDNAAHRHRKAMFLALLSATRVGTLGAIFRQDMQRSATAWSRRSQIVLYDELQQVLTRCVCAWAGVPLSPEELKRRTAQLAAMFDWAGQSGMKHFRSRIARRQAEHWVADLIERVRDGTFKPVEDSAIDRIALHRDLSGHLLSPEAAAVELLNVLRPTVAVAVYIVFIVHALHQFPEVRELMAQADTPIADAFVQEVRRFYPFFPAVPAKVREAFRWNGYDFPQGARALLDLHGINHDERIWDAPDEFRPQRFLRWDGNAYEFVPQGGGDHLKHHRCPGEWLTVELMRQSLGFFTRDIRYTVPPQDVTIDTRRLPALPKSKIILTDVSSLLSSYSSPSHSMWEWDRG
jgi:fatty-acid peroxygenase